MKLKSISTDNLSITRDHNGEHDIFVFRGLLDGLGLRHDNQAQRGQLWLNPDEARTLHKMLGAMLEGNEEPTP